MSEEKDPVLFKSKEEAEAHITKLKKLRPGRKGQYSTYEAAGHHGVSYVHPKYAQPETQHQEVVNVRVDPKQFTEEEAEEIVSRGPAGGNS